MNQFAMLSIIPGSTAPGRLFAAFVLALLLSACAPPEPTPPATGMPLPLETATPIPPTANGVRAAGGVLTVGLAGSVLTFDPADQRDAATQIVLRNLYDGLVAASPSGKLVPELAESFTLVDDLTWEFRLRPGVTFHNGEPLTAVDVQFTFERIIHPAGIDAPAPHDSPWRADFAPLQRVEAVDDLTIRFYLARPWPAGMQLLAYQGVLPAAYYRQVGGPGFLARPVGSGPFQFAGLDEEGAVTLVRYAGYYGGAAAIPPVGPALLDKVVFRPIADDAARVQALLADDVQVVQQIPPPLVSQLTGSMDWANRPVSACGGFYDWEPTPQPSNITVVPVPASRPVWLALNLKQPPLDQPDVRRALSLALRRDFLIAFAAFGRAAPLNGPLSPFNHFADLSLPPFEYDPDQARALFSASGVTPSGLALTIETTPQDAATAEGVARQFRQLGLAVDVRQWDDAAALRAALQNGGWMMAVQGVADAGLDAAVPLAAPWHTNSPDNLSGYSNPQVDALLDAAAVETDEARRHELYNQVQALIREDAPAVFLFVPLQAEACAGGVHNWTPAPDGLLSLGDVWLGAAVPEALTADLDRAGLLVSAAWLAAHLEGANLRLIDLRPESDYRSAHIPNAAHLDLNAVRAEVGGVPGQVVSPDVAANVFSEIGIGANAMVVVYDGGDGRDAARLFWTLAYYGRSDIHLLDGGFAAWQAAGRNLSADAPHILAENFVPDPNPALLATADEALAASGDEQVALVDARSDAEFNGLDVRAARGGHIPGAVQIEWSRNLNSNLTFKSKTDLQAMYTAAGVTPDKTVIVYCQTGHRAALTYFVLRWLGYSEVKLYDGSWAEWGNDLSLPIEP